MADHHSRRLTLDDIHVIIGRGMLDEDFRTSFVDNYSDVVSNMGISIEDDARAVTLLEAIKGVFAGDYSMQDAMDEIKKVYNESSDGVVRPRCF